MRWEAHTNYPQIGVGTVFRILALPQVAGHPPDVLRGGEELWIVGNDPPPIRSVVDSASPDEVFITMDGGARWRMTPVQAGELGSGITTSGRHAEDWKIREPVT